MSPSSDTKGSRVSLRQQVLQAALECSGGDLHKTFSPEDLLLAAWRRNPLAWGLRGHETEYPDSERLRMELDRASVRGGMVGLGFFDKVRQRVYRLTPGLLAANEVSGEDEGVKGRVERSIADAVSDILSHQVFVKWLKDQSYPKYFRDAGHFWGVAPGTPPSVIRSRIANVDQTLSQHKLYSNSAVSMPYPLNTGVSYLIAPTLHVHWSSSTF